MWRWMEVVSMGLIAMAAWTAGATSGFAQPMNAHQGAQAAAPLALALRPPPAGGTAPVIAVLALNEGTETTDFLVPHAVLQLAQVGVVDAVAPSAGAVTLMPALQVEVPRSFAAFDSVYPQGADIVVVPALHTDDDPAVLVWLQAQAAKGAVVVGICSGARVLARRGCWMAAALRGTGMTAALCCGAKRAQCMYPGSAMWPMGRW